MSAIKFGLIGTGNMAHTMAEAFSHSDLASITAVMSASSDRAQSFANAHQIPTAVTSIDELIKQNIDAVYIANSSSQHALSAVALLKAGIPVLCEKPAALNYSEMEQVIHASKASNTLFMEGFWTLSLPSHQHLIRQIEEGGLGHPRFFSSSFGYPVSEVSFPKLFDQGGGALLDRGGYLIALAVRLMGSVESVCGDIVLSSNEVDTDFAVNIKHQKGGISQLKASLLCLLDNDASVSCSQGSIRLHPPALGAELSITQYCQAQETSVDPLKQPSFKGRLVSRLKSLPFVRRLKSIKSNGKVHNFSYGRNQYLPQLNHFCSLIKQNKTESPWVPHQLSLDVIRTTDLIREQATKHRS